MILGLIGTAAQFLWPNQRWIGWAFIGLAVLIAFGVVVWALAIRHAHKQGVLSSTEKPRQQMTQTGIDFKPHIEVNPTFTQTQSQEQSQRQVIAERKIETLPSEIEDTDVYEVSAFLSAWGKLHDSKDDAHYRCESAQIDFHLKPLPNSDEWVEVRTQIVFYDEDYHKLRRVKDGVWRATHPEDTKVNIPFRRGDTKTFVVALDVSGEGLTTYEHGVHNPGRPFMHTFLSPTRMPLGVDTVIAQVRLIGEYFQVIRFDEPYWFKVSRLPKFKIEKMVPPIFDRANLD